MFMLHTYNLIGKRRAVARSYTYKYNYFGIIKRQRYPTTVGTPSRALRFITLSAKAGSDASLYPCAPPMYKIHNSIGKSLIRRKSVPMRAAQVQKVSPPLKGGLGVALNPKRE